MRALCALCALRRTAPRPPTLAPPRTATRPHLRPPSLALATHHPRTRPRRLLGEILKPRAFSFFAKYFKLCCSLPNLSEKDVKKLLFRKQQRTGGFNLSKSGKRFKLYCQLPELE